MNKVRTIFFGSGEFAVPILKKLFELEYLDLVSIVTQPDKPVGRKQILTPTPVGQETQNNEQFKINNTDILKPQKLKEISDEILQKYNPELIIVASYGQIIPSNIINFPKYKCLNFHGSLLPELRGAVPVQMAILQGLSKTGVTLQVMQDGMDEGEMISQDVIDIGDMNSEQLMSDLANLSVEILQRDLPLWLDNKIELIPQDHNKATYCYKKDLNKEDAELFFETDIYLSDRKIRAFNPWPVAFVQLPITNYKLSKKEESKQLKMLKIFKAKIIKNPELINQFQEKYKFESLEIVRKDKRLFLLLKNGVLELLELQLEGKKRGLALDYLFLT